MLRYTVGAQHTSFPLPFPLDGVLWSNQVVKPSFNAGALEIANFSRFPVVDVQEEEERDRALRSLGVLLQASPSLSPRKIP